MKRQHFKCCRRQVMATLALHHRLFEFTSRALFSFGTAMNLLLLISSQVYFTKFSLPNTLQCLKAMVLNPCLGALKWRLHKCSRVLNELDKTHSPKAQGILKGSPYYPAHDLAVAIGLINLFGVKWLVGLPVFWQQLRQFPVLFLWQDL